MTQSDGSTDPPAVLSTILIGPHLDLHAGFHGSLKSDPPPGFTFHQRGARHLFILDEGHGRPSDLTPFDVPHLGEFADFGPGPQLVHSARWPVVRRRAWIADLDDFGYPLLLGRFALDAAGRTADVWSEGRDALARRRAANMLTAYAHPSCQALLFWTQHALQAAQAWLRNLDLGELGEAFLAKSEVLYPAQKPLLLPPGVEAKWSNEGQRRVLFIGNSYEVKNGRMALRIFGRLQEKFPDARFTYVGVVPEKDRDLADRVDYRGSLPRREVLSLLRESHVLFHPSKAESFGMVLLEAAASGMAIITARGPEMEHIPEILSDRQAMLVDRSRVSESEEESHFQSCLENLLAQSRSARRMAMESYQETARGRFAVDRRNQRLSEIYSRAEAEPAKTGFQGDQAPFAGARSMALSSDEVLSRQQAFREKRGLTAFNFYVDAEGFRSQQEMDPVPPTGETSIPSRPA